MMPIIDMAQVARRQWRGNHDQDAVLPELVHKTLSPDELVGDGLIALVRGAAPERPAPTRPLPYQAELDAAEIDRRVDVMELRNRIQRKRDEAGGSSIWSELESQLNAME
jgi:hypothetical protein